MTPTPLPKLASIVAGAALVLALCLVPIASAQVEAEPNDDYETAMGPLAPSTTYSGLLDNDADVDLYYFYVTSPSSETHLTISDPTVDGGGVYAELEDSDGGEISGVDVPAEDFDTLEATLDPGLYYLWIEMGQYEIFNETYEVTTSGGGAGSFSSPSQAQAKCKTATAAISKAQATLDRAKRRLRLARKSDSHEQKVKAQHAVKVAKARLRAASAEQKLLCSIPV